MSIDFIVRFNEENVQNGFWNLKRQAGAVLFVLFLALIMFNASGCTQTEDITNIEDNVEELPQETVKTGNDGVNAAIAPDDVSIVDNQSGKKTEMVSMSIEDMGRSDPFLPEHENKVVVKVKPRQYNDLLPPPEMITIDTTATDVITTKVSGIMFDNLNPSAIINIGGADYLVRTGDIINGYKVLSIGKETVTVQYGANVYKAGVGQLFNTDGINFNTISNLESKFGGRKNSSNKN